MNPLILTFEIFICFQFVLSQSKVGDRCAIRANGERGVCTLDCKIASEYEFVGIRPGLCGYMGTVPILCCPDNYRETTTVRYELPDRNSGGSFVFPDESGGLRKSEQMCEEYKKHVTRVIQAIPLVQDPSPISISVTKCDYTGLPLIVGGTQTLPGEFPHMAAIGYNNNGVTEYNCGGSLISEEYILTAAHCVVTLKGPPVTVRLGEQNMNREDDGAEPQDFAVRRVLRHPEYRPPKKYHDIGLIQLQQRVTFNKFMRPACLWTQPQIENSKAVATGWGQIDWAEAKSDELLKVVLDIIDFNRCKGLYNSQRALPNGISSEMLCAGVLSGGRDTCQGDSGGPIVVTNRSNQCLFYVIGITSFGKQCAAANAPGIYTRVSSYLSWIEDNVWP